MQDQAPKSLEIDVDTCKGSVQLSGFVDSPQQVADALYIAGSVPGMRTVENNLVLK